MPTTYRIAYRTDSNQVADCAVPTLAPLRRAEASDAWVRLPDRARIRPSWLVSIARCENGRPVAAWLVSEHGLDGTRSAAEKPTPSGFSWRQAWREVAAMTEGLTAEDARLPAVLRRLDDLEAAYQVGDQTTFLVLMGSLRRNLSGS